MNCRQIQDELLLLVGEEIIPQDIKRHIDECAECRQLWTELTLGAEALGGDGDFHLDDAVVERLTVGVDERIDALEMTEVTSISSLWRSYVPAAAAIVLLMGISFTAYIAGWLGGNGQQSGLIGSDTLWVTVDDNAVAALSADELPQMLDQLFIDNDQAVQAFLQDDLTEDEYEYLAENLDVGDIL